MRPDSDPRPKPINARNILWWAARTYAWDRRRYRGRGGLPSARGLAATLRPNIRAPIFVIGADRSGTTFLGDCLAAVPQISYHHEPEAIKAAARHVYENEWSYRRARLFFRTVYGWLMRVHFDGHLRFAEKTPTNSFIVPFLARAFPDSVFIHIVRDGRDATVSHLRQPWLLAASLATGRREPGGYRHGPDARFWVEPQRRKEFEATSDVHRCTWSWRRHTESALSGGRELQAERYHELRYEDLVTEPAAEGQRLLDFLGIREAGSRAALLDALAKADRRSVGTWRASLGAEELATIDDEAGDLLRQLGYA